MLSWAVERKATLVETSPDPNILDHSLRCWTVSLLRQRRKNLSFFLFIYCEPKIAVLGTEEARQEIKKKILHCVFWENCIRLWQQLDLHAGGLAPVWTLLETLSLSSCGCKKKASSYQCSKFSNWKGLMAQWHALMINYQSPLCTCVPCSSKLLLALCISCLRLFMDMCWIHIIFNCVWMKILNR